MRPQIKPLPDKKYLLNLFRYDPLTGVLFWRERPRSHFSSDRGWNMWNSKFSGREAGSFRKDGYATVSIDSEAYEIHRIVWKLHVGRDPRVFIDHIDGDKFNNRISNLREATSCQNNSNAKARRNKKSAYKGVSVRQGNGSKVKYIAVVRSQGVKQHIAVCDTELEAHLAYVKKAKELHGEFHNPGNVEIVGLSFEQLAYKMLEYKSDLENEKANRLHVVSEYRMAETKLAAAAAKLSEALNTPNLEKEELIESVLDILIGSQESLG